MRDKILLVTYTMGWVNTRLATTIPFWLKNFPLTWLPTTKLKPLQYAKNWSVEEFLKKDYTHLWMVDADIAPHPNTLNLLLEANVPAVAAKVHQLKVDDDGIVKAVPMLMRRDENGDFKAVQGRGVAPVDRAGFACILFRRSVFHSIKAPWFESRPMGRFRGTDYNFAEKMEASNIPLFGHFDTECLQLVEDYI